MIRLINETIDTPRRLTCVSRPRRLKVEEAFFATLANAVSLAGCKFVMIIDEWDAPVREGIDQPKAQSEYLE